MSTFPADHPRASEILTLASSDEPEKLAEVLREEGLPEDLFVSADSADLPLQGEVLICGNVCHYSITEHVVEIKGALPFAQELIARANHLNRWRDSTQINSEQSYVNENRSSSYQIVDEQYYNELHGRLREVMLESGRFYQCFNKGLFFRKDENWELLRYQESDRFGPHVDCIAGTMFDRRMLTVLAYLNDDFEGGETRFVSPGPEMTVKPEQGKIVMFPPYYTHPHEGLVVTAGTKYAVLGWLYA